MEHSCGHTQFISSWIMYNKHSAHINSKLGRHDFLAPTSFQCAHTYCDSFEHGVFQVPEDYSQQAIAVVGEILQAKWWRCIVSLCKFIIKSWILDTLWHGMKIIIGSKEGHLLTVDCIVESIGQCPCGIVTILWIDDVGRWQIHWRLIDKISLKSYKFTSCLKNIIPSEWYK